ncbi:MAG: outer membrane protein transport protein [Ignavibacteriaceae bacterium]|nr:outer membrane protein transport protein [Ignavibacteriaceae bacterium]
MKSKITILIISLLSFAESFAGGFQINEHGAKAMGRGNAFTAVANDPSAIYFNGAGLTQLEGTNFLFGTTLIAPAASFRGVAPEITEYNLEKKVFTPVHFFGSYRINEDLAVGLGFTTPFGLGTKWDADWVGRYLAVETELMTFTLSPVIAYNLLPNLSISAGFVYSFANVTITQKTPQTPFAGDAFVDLEGDETSAFGYNFGVLYKPTPKFSVGASFHSEIEYNFEGTAKTTGASQLASKLPNGDVKAKLTTPLNLAFGVAYQFTDELNISADFQYIGWKSYDTLKVDFVDPAYDDLASPRNYQNSWIARLGGEYKVTNTLTALAGIYYDKMPVEPEYLSPSLPDADRLGFTLGVDYKLTNSLGIGISYLFIRASELTVDNSKEMYTSGNTPFNGTYNSSASLLAVSFSYGF